VTWVYPLALLFDMVVGDPRSSLHPVALIGQMIAWFERRLWVLGDSPALKKIKGALLVFLVLAISYGAVYELMRIVNNTLPPVAVVLIEALLLSFTISPGSLTGAGREIQEQLLNENLTEARWLVSQIVGRDTQALGEREITRATVETMAENIVDGIISPLFFAWIGGAPLAYLYRAVNTMDSMLGYRNERYGDFGMAAARTDDVFNYIPARITGMLIVLAALLLRFDPMGAARAIWRDAARHPSPNSGFSEAGVAGALGVQLGGLNYYGGIPSCRATMGEPLQELQAVHISKTASLVYMVTLLFSVAITGMGYYGFQRFWGL
jgi:adenosylcobinamide-phosphate synthase